ncbi:MAG: glycyl-radical enzyme activating protein [Anaerolineales bacterium]|nr:glycyl-radical enzyme activating protein [Anaerolineales bacterium]
MSSGLIFDIRKFSIHDGPGIRTTVFLKGCPLACQWCHNPESQSFQPELILFVSRCIRCGYCLETCEQGAISLNGDGPHTDQELCTVCGECLDACAADARQLVGNQMSVEQVMEVIQQDLPFYDESGGGVTFSGGEPLGQRAFLLELLQACKALDMHTALDTSGYASWAAFEQVRPYVDIFLYDLKLIDSAAHRTYTNVPNELILENLGKLARAGHEIIIRVPVIPGITDTPENLEGIGALLAELPNIQRVDLLPYHGSAEGKYDRLHKAYALAEMTTPEDTQMDALAALLQNYGLHVQIGG